MKNFFKAIPFYVIDILILAVLLGIYYAIDIGNYPLFTPDEGRYSEIAREMFVSKDFITPHLNGVVFLDKPILYYWLQVSAIKWFGLKEWALRFWPAFFGVLGAILTYFAGLKLFNRRTGILGAICLATSPLYYGAAHYANLDLEVSVLISGSLIFSLLAIKEPVKRRHFFIIAYIFSSFAILTKGLIGIVFPMLIIGSFILCTRRFYLIKSLQIGTGFCIIMLLAAPWYILAQYANPTFFHYFFLTQQFSRFLAHEGFNNQTPLWFYLPIIVIGFVPWSLFIIQSICLKMQKNATEVLFLLLWISIILLFFSIPTSKTVGYILPIFPALSLLIARYFDTIWHKQFLGFLLGIIFFAVASIFFQIVISHLKHRLYSIDKIIVMSFPFLHFMVIFSLLISMIFLFLLFLKKSSRIYILFLTLWAVLLTMTIIFAASVVNQRSIKPIALYLEKHATENSIVVCYFKYYQDLPLYIKHKVIVVENWNDKNIMKHDNWLRELSYEINLQKNKNVLLTEPQFWQQWFSSKRVYVLLSKNKYPHFAAKAHAKIHFIMQVNDVLLLSN